jgi:DNA-binding transcriptional ArsR family regulator
MQSFMKITKALADENRVRMLWALRGKELCVCQLIELLELAPSTVSKHLSILKNADLVAHRKTGRWIYYRLISGAEQAQSRQALDWVFDSIQGAAQLKADALRLKQILTIDTDILCRRNGRSCA